MKLCKNPLHMDYYYMDYCHMDYIDYHEILRIKMLKMIKNSILYDYKKVYIQLKICEKIVKLREKKTCNENNTEITA